MKKAIIGSLVMLLSLVAMGQSKKDAPPFGVNLISVTPVSILDRGIGLGLHYERLLDDEQKIAFVLPVDIVFEDMSSSFDVGKSLFYTYLSPGFIFYPVGLKNINYGIGPNILMALGTGSRWVSNTWGTQQSLDYTNFRMGVMINNYIIANIKHNFSLSINAGMGLRYINNYTYSNNSKEKDGISVMGQFKLAFGYRF
jgi:hypothetical protein